MGKIKVFNDVHVSKSPYYRGGNKIVPMLHLDEVFKDYPLNPMYMVSNYGRVYCKRGYMVSQFENREGYMYAKVDSQNTAVHRMVGLAFNYVNNYEKLDINHKNGSKHDNFPNNLEWSSRSENVQHAFNNGLSKQGEDHPNSVFTSEEIHNICNLISQGYGAKYISQSIGRSYNQIKSVVQHIKEGRDWKPIARLYGI